MTAPRYGEGEGLLWIKGRAEPEAETSVRVQSEERWEGKGRELNQVQQPRGQRYKMGN